LHGDHLLRRKSSQTLSRNSTDFKGEKRNTTIGDANILDREDGVAHVPAHHEHENIKHLRRISTN